MIITKLYDFILSDGTIFTTTEDTINIAFIERTERFSLQAEENKILSNGSVQTSHVYTSAPEEWREIDRTPSEVD